MDQDTLIRIFTLLEPKDFFNFFLVCKEWSYISTLTYIWYTRLRRDFPNIIEAQLCNSKLSDFEKYKILHNYTVNTFHKILEQNDVNKVEFILEDPNTSTWITGLSFSWCLENKMEVSLLLLKKCSNNLFMDYLRNFINMYSDNIEHIKTIYQMCLERNYKLLHSIIIDFLKVGLKYDDFDFIKSLFNVEEYFTYNSLYHLLDHYKGNPKTLEELLTYINLNTEVYQHVFNISVDNIDSLRIALKNPDINVNNEVIQYAWGKCNMDVVKTIIEDPRFNRRIEADYYIHLNIREESEPVTEYILSHKDITFGVYTTSHIVNYYANMDNHIMIDVIFEHPGHNLSKSIFEIIRYIVRNQRLDLMYKLIEHHSFEAYQCIYPDILNQIARYGDVELLKLICNPDSKFNKPLNLHHHEVRLFSWAHESEHIVKYLLNVLKLKPSFDDIVGYIGFKTLPLLLKDPSDNYGNFNNRLLVKASELSCKIEHFKLILERRDVDPSFRDNVVLKNLNENHGIEYIKLFLHDPRVNPTTKENVYFTRLCCHGDLESIEMIIDHPKLNLKRSINEGIILSLKHNHLDVCEYLLNHTRFRKHIKIERLRELITKLGLKTNSRIWDAMYPRKKK